MDKIKTPFTNVTLQTFASEGDMALVDQRWEKYGPNFLKRLSENGLLSFERVQIWNKDSKLMRFIIFRYKSADGVKNCAPIWEEIEQTIFKCWCKVIAYRGISKDYWLNKLTNFSLILGIIYQSSQHLTNIWLPYAYLEFTPLLPVAFEA